MNSRNSTFFFYKKINLFLFNLVRHCLLEIYFHSQQLLSLNLDNVEWVHKISSCCLSDYVTAALSFLTRWFQPHTKKANGVSSLFPRQPDLSFSGFCR